jgi:hypothetical protein
MQPCTAGVCACGIAQPVALYIRIELKKLLKAHQEQWQTHAWFVQKLEANGNLMGLHH